MKERQYFLSDEKEKLLNVINNGRKYYGGNQNWFKEKNKIYNGCGPIAAANILYFEKRKRDKNVNYKQLMEDFYNNIKPGLLGLTSINKFIKAVLDYGKTQGIDLKYEKLIKRNKNFTYSSALNFIINGIIKDVPVAALNLDIRKKSKFSWHWVLITGVVRKSNKDFLKISSWGKKYFIDFSKVYDYMAYGGGFVYFY